MSCIYHFDGHLAPALIPRFLELTSMVDLHIGKLGLESAVRLVPYYEVGSDFLVQAKAPYDGGYSTSRFGEFIVDGDCKPPPGFVLSRAQLCEVLIEQRGKLDAGSAARTQLLSTVLHTCWTLFRPWIGKELMESTALAPR